MVVCIEPGEKWCIIRIEVEPDTEHKVEFALSQEDLIGSNDEEEDHNSETQEIKK